jgi:uncharacterized protein (DUF488 family)
VNLLGTGYEGKTQQQVCNALLTAGVDILVDVRLTPISRKPGLSKSALAQAVQEVGVKYLHLPELGNPKWNRAGFGGDALQLDGARDAFRRVVLSEPAAQAALRRVRELAVGLTVSLLCFEADQIRCHRDVVIAELLADPLLVG